jgi:hypothetical protein
MSNLPILSFCLLIQAFRTLFVQFVDPVILFVDSFVQFVDRIILFVDCIFLFSNHLLQSVDLNRNGLCQLIDLVVSVGTVTEKSL